MCLLIGRAYDIPAVALRFFNIFGTRQALSNPYTGVLAIFASRLLNGKPPLINEDGYQRRDFVSVQDVARACRLALETPAAAGQVFNVGSGQQYTIREIAARMARVLGKEHLSPEITGQVPGRETSATVSPTSAGRARVLGYEPRITLEKGLLELAEWLGRPGRDRPGRAMRGRRSSPREGLAV